MTKRFAVVGATLLAFLFSLLAVQPAHAEVGLHIENGKLVESNGNEFIFRGVSHPHVWFQDQTQSFADIKSLGANSVRVVLGSGQQWGPSPAEDVSNVIEECKANKLICVLEVHDTTGYGEDGAAATLDQAVDYWISIQDALEGQENYIIVNIGNEPIGNNNAAQWTDATSNAISRMREAGFDHLLMVDGPNWGQDWENVMRDNAASVLQSDPTGNTMFSIHMYGVYDTPQKVSDYLEAFQSAGLPINIGEFGHQHSDGDPAEDAIMANAVNRGIGYIGWSWSGNTDPILDMTENFDVNSLTEWGERIFNGPNGIAETAEEATIYN